MRQNSRILFNDENFNSKSRKPHIINISISHLYLVALISGISGMLVHNLMGVNLRFVSSGHIFWIFLGVSAGMSMYSPDSAKEEERPSLPKQGFSIKIVLSLILILLLIPGFFFFRKYFIADIHHNIAIAYSKIKRWDEALRHYNKVLEYNPYFIMTHYFMGNVYNDRWDMESKHNPEWDGPDGKPRNDAERTLDKYADVKVLAPNYVMLHYQEGLIYQKLQLWKKAIESFKKALALDPVFPLTHFHMGICYAQLEDFANSEESFKESIKWNPRFVQAHINLGNVYLIEKKYQLAEEAYQKAIEVNPRYLDARRNLAVFYERVGNIPRAIEAWQGILDINPEHKDAKNAIKELKGKKGR